MFLNTYMSARSKVSQLMHTCSHRALTTGPKWLGKFRADKAGNIGMMLAMMILPATAAVGMAIDYGRAYSNKHTVQQIIDAAVLAGGRSFDSSHNTASGIEIAQSYFTKSLPDDIDAQITHLGLTDEGKVELSVNIKIETYFLKLVGRPELEATVRAESTPEQGGSLDVEMAVVFDVTGSMGSGTGSKMEVAKLAAKDLVDIMIPEGDTSGSTRISLVPFSEMVDVGPDYIAAVTGEPASKTVTENNGWTRRCEKWRNGTLRDTWSEDYDDQDDWDSDDEPHGSGWTCQWTEKTIRRTYYRKNCTVERLESVAGDAAYDDTPPTSSSTRFHAFWTTSSGSINSSCVPSKTLMPLTSDRNALRTHINTFSSNGGTAGHIGTAWGWYTISERWAGLNIWPAASEPEENDADRRMKALVIMTDGDYNHQYNSSFNSSSSGANGSSQSQAAQICEAAKADNVEVFAVGVQISNAARTFLQNCVSDPNNLFAIHYYDAATAADVRPAFQAIAEAVSSATNTGSFRLRLTR